VGYYVNQSTIVLPLIYTSTNGGDSWSLFSTDLVPNTAMLGVSCSSTGQNCTAVGIIEAAPFSYITTNGGIDWTPGGKFPLPEDIETLKEPLLTFVACDNKGLSCFAVGKYS
jgi:hypothetical protein